VPLRAEWQKRLAPERWSSNLSDADRAASRSPDLVCLALGVVYLHFGLLKFFPDLSPAEMIASQTIMRLSSSWLDAHTALRLLALLECAIGLGFLFGIATRWLALAFFAHMAGTTLPLFVLPELVFKIAPFAPTLEGQYILKNLVLAAAGWSVLAPRLALAKPSLSLGRASSRARLGPAARSRV
jgi:uncharacterized membrane protein YkgB